MRSFVVNFLLTFFLCGVVSFFALGLFNYPLTGIDDANIYFVYARNLANGYGFVYNVGGERVEGFTSLLWTIIAALTFKISSHPEIILLIISVVLLSLGIAIALTYLQDGFSGEKENQPRKLLWSGLFLILLLTSPRYMVWNTITLMENALWSTLLLVLTIFVIKDQTSPPSTNLLFIPLLILLLLTRPESLLWGPVFVGVLFVRTTLAKNTISAFKDLAPSILSLMIAMALLTLFRFKYFGYPFPNTYYAKVSPSLGYNLQQGFDYFLRYARSEPIAFVSISMMIIASLHTLFGVFSKRFPDEGSFFLPIIGLIGLLTPLITGGDHFGSFRLYQNIYPIEILCLLYFVRSLLPPFVKFFERFEISPWRLRAFKVASILVIGIVFCASQFQLWTFIKPELRIEFEVADYGRKSGTFIQKLFSPLPQLPSLGVVTSGGIKYSYTGPIVDFMGLNNTLMAHNHGDRKGIRDHAAFDIPTFYRLQPDVVWPVTVIEKDWYYSETAVKESWENTEGLKGLFDQAYFLELYTYAKVKDKSNNGYALVAWFKKDLIKLLSTNTNFEVEEYPYTP